MLYVRCPWALWGLGNVPKTFLAMFSGRSATPAGSIFQKIFGHFRLGFSKNLDIPSPSIPIDCRSLDFHEIAEKLRNRRVESKSRISAK